VRDFSRYDPYLAILEFATDISPIEAERRAEKCFHAQSLLVRELHTAEYAELLVGDNVEMVKSELILRTPQDYKNAESRKAWVHTRPERKEIYEKYARSKADLDHLRRLLKLFEGGCFYFSQKAKR